MTSHYHCFHKYGIFKQVTQSDTLSCFLLQSYRIAQLVESYNGAAESIMFMNTIHQQRIVDFHSEQTVQLQPLLKILMILMNA